MSDLEFDDNQKEALEKIYQTVDWERRPYEEKNEISMYGKHIDVEHQLATEREIELDELLIETVGVLRTNYLLSKKMLKDSDIYLGKMSLWGKKGKDKTSIGWIAKELKKHE